MPFTFPASTVGPLREAPVLRWGILAPGGIAASFAHALAAHTDQVVSAVGSRSAERAEQFAGRFGIAFHAGSYDAVVARPDVDVVYVAAPQSEHRALTLLAIAAGKHVLVEKPFTTTAAEAEEVVHAARRAGVFAMEAMWTRYLPHIDVMRRMVESGQLGEVRMVGAHHGQRMPSDSRLLRPELGGGALLDLGIYPFAFASELLGSPTAASVSGTLTESGVDAQSAVTLEYARPTTRAVLTTTLLAKTPNTAFVAGTEGLLELGAPFFAPASLRYSTAEFTAPVAERPADTLTPMHEGLCYQAVALARYVGEGRTESPLHTLDETVRIMRSLDSARHALGFRLPSEEAAPDRA